MKLTYKSVLTGSIATLSFLVFASTAFAAGPPAINLGTAGYFVILGETGVSDVPTSAITGDVGLHPAAGSFLSTNLCSEVTGTIYVTSAQAGCAVLASTRLGTAVGDMGTAYTNASAPNTPAGTGGTNLNVGAGTLSGLTFVPGVYTWGTNVTITNDITISGTASDVWVFQVNGTLDIQANKKIILLGGALPQNIFWQVTGQTTLLAGSQFQGVILDQVGITMNAGATINGRLLSQSLVALNSNTITDPSPVSSTKNITSFTIPTGTTVISGTNIQVTVPGGTDVTALVPTIVTTGASVSPNSGVAGNFSSPVTYTVTGQNASTKIYTVTVIVSPISNPGGTRRDISSLLATGYSSGTSGMNGTSGTNSQIQTSTNIGVNNQATISSIKAQLTVLIKQLIAILQAQIVEQRGY
jgi:hypothetical protein